jgi:hypothetical protein
MRAPSTHVRGRWTYLPVRAARVGGTIAPRGPTAPHIAWRARLAHSGTRKAWRSIRAAGFACRDFGVLRHPPTPRRCRAPQAHTGPRKGLPPQPALAPAPGAFGVVQTPPPLSRAPQGATVQPRASRQAPALGNAAWAPPASLRRKGGPRRRRTVRRARTARPRTRCPCRALPGRSASRAPPTDLCRARQPLTAPPRRSSRPARGVFTARSAP